MKTSLDIACQIIPTPTFAGTILGFLSLALWLFLGIDYLDVVAAALLGAVGVGGVAMAIGFEVERDSEIWSWSGIYRSLRHRSFLFHLAFWGHVPQALTGIALAFTWRFG